MEAGGNREESIFALVIFKTHLTYYEVGFNTVTAVSRRGPVAAESPDGSRPRKLADVIEVSNLIYTR